MHLDKNKSERFWNLFDAKIDWDYLILAARYHRFIPFLFNSFKLIPETQLPPAVLEEVSQSFYHTVEWNLLATAELFSIVENLNIKGIASIPFKGPVLSRVLYGDISHRQFDDLDILIHRKNFQETKEILIAKGYQPEQKMNLMQESVLLRSQHHFQFYNNSSKFTVEIHWEISPRIYSFNLDLADVWHRMQPVTLSEREVVTLSPADTLLILCEHGSRHYWKRLLWIADIARLVELKGIDWPDLMRLAREIGSERVLLLGIYLAKTLFYAEVPPSISRRIGNDPEIWKLANRVLDEIYSGRVDSHQLSLTSDTPNIDEELFYLQARERLRDRVRYYVRRATTPTMEDLNFFVLPDYLYSLYPLVRIGRLMRRYKSRIWRWI